MKKFTLLLAAGAILLNSCSKTSQTPSKPKSVTIQGKAYSTVVLGGQTWTAVNYDGSGGVAIPDVDENTYGKLYEWPEAQAVTLPAGWRLPTKQDFSNLLKSQGALIDNIVLGTESIDPALSAHFRSQDNWTLPGDNASGFNAQPAGEYNYFINEYNNTYAYATFWGSTFETHGANPTRQIVLTIVGYYSSPGTGHTPMIGATTSAFEAGGKLSYSLRFVKDN